MLVSPAPAKLNLSLEVVGKRPDGYHELVSVMQTISLADQLEIELDARFTFQCSDASLTGNDNLVVCAAELLRVAHGVPRGASIRLDKRIPVAAGLGGGSSDAASALAALSRLWKLPGTCETLLRLAETIGSDVPFFLTAGAALVQGRGERVEALPPLQETWYVLAKPPIAVSTREVYGAVTAEDWTDGNVSRDMAASIRAGDRVGIGCNGLQAALFRLYPSAEACFDSLERLAPGRPMVSGSGPTVFVPFESEAEARDVAHRVPAEFWSAVARNWDPAPGDAPCGDR